MRRIPLPPPQHLLQRPATIFLLAQTGLAGIDWAVLVGYFLILLVVVWRSSRKQESSKDYFLAGRNIGWFAVGASLFASNIGSEHIVGLSGSGYTTGGAMAHWELHAWIILMLGWVFVPFYYRTGVYTMPEFLERRFNATARWILSVVSLVAYVFTKISVTVYAGAIVFSALLPDLFTDPDHAFWVGALLTVVVTGVYTVFGGFRAVVYTDAMQAVVLLIGSVAITAYGISALGGFSELQLVCRENAVKFSLWRPMDDPDFPWLGILIASPIVGIWYWCTDQYIVQRTLAARDLRAARRGTIWGAFLKLAPVFIFLLPGLIAYALVQKDLLVLDDADKAFPSMVQALLPVGLRGLVVAGLIAALMSSLSSMFNSCSALFTIDIYHKLHPEASERHLVRVGRIATLMVVGLGILWIPVMKFMAGGGLYKYLQEVQGYLAPPITAVFLLGLFSKRITSKGAVVGLVFGFFLGMAKLTLQAVHAADQKAMEVAKETGDQATIKAAEAAAILPDWLAAIGSFNFLYFSGVLFAISIVVIVGVSLMTKAPDEAKIANLTFSTCTEEQRRENRASWNRWDVIATVAILAGVVGIYLFFTVWLWRSTDEIRSDIDARLASGDQQVQVMRGEAAVKRDYVTVRKHYRKLRKDYIVVAAQLAENQLTDDDRTRIAKSLEQWHPAIHAYQEVMEDALTPVDSPEALRKDGPPKFSKEDYERIEKTFGLDDKQAEKLIKTWEAAEKPLTEAIQSVEEVLKNENGEVPKK